VVAVEYLGPSAEVYLPQCGVLAARGEPVEVPDEVAGRAPGPWRAAEPGEVTPGGGWTAIGWPLHQLGDGTWLTRDPGEGLLAQEDAWALPGAARPVQVGESGPDAVVPANGQEG